jgi:small-conductance mechanosensitive channel
VNEFVTALTPWLTSAAILAALVLAVLGLHAIVYGILGRMADRTTISLDDSFLKHSRGPTRLLLPLVGVEAGAGLLSLSPEAIGYLRHAVGLGLVGAVGWLAISLLSVIDDAMGLRYRLDAQDNLTARRVLTQVTVLQRILTTLIIIVTIAIGLMTFPQIRQLGASLLASAGLAGLVVGLAARSTLANLLAGIQVALTEPIRLDDVVIVEGEWGRIEEIHTSFVVVKIWDLRRLVVPISYFIEKPFQNWTRTSADLIGSVFLYVDYTTPVDAVRAELQRVLEASRDLWDGKVANLQVTDAKERTLELRALMSTADSGAGWDLRCRVRERLVAFLQEQHPDCLPRLRAEVQGSGLVAEPSHA